MAKAVIEKKSDGIAAIFVATWALALLIAFFAYRGDDVGRLPSLIGSLGGGQWFGLAGFGESVAGLVIAALIGICWFGLGIISRLLIGNSNDNSPLTLVEIVCDIAVGAAIWSCVWFFLGLAGIYTQSIAVAALVVGLVAAAFGIRRFLSSKGGIDRERLSVVEKTLTVLIAVPLALALIASIAPPTAKDTLLYHFALPKEFIAHGSNSIVEGNIASFLALGAEMHSVWAMLLGGFVGGRVPEAAAGATSFLFFPLLLGAIYGWARELKIQRIWSLLAVLIVGSVPTAFYVAASAYIDLALALYVTLAIYALSRWWKRQERVDLVFSAIFLGAALSIKLTSVFIFAAVALIILLKARSVKAVGGSPGKIALTGIAALLLAGVIASPWYLRTWKVTGSPVFPFYMNIWKGSAEGWDAERSALFQAMNSQYGGEDKNALDYLLAPVKISVMAQPELSAFYDGVIGVAFLIGLPVLIWGLWKFETPVEIKIGAGVAGVMFLFWLFSSQQLRYLLPILPVLALGVTCAGEVISIKNDAVRKVLHFFLAASAIAGIAVSAAWFLQESPLRVVFGGESRDEYLTRNLDYYPYYQWLNANTDEKARVWLINMRRDTYNLDRAVFSDYLFEDWTLRKMIWDSRSAHELRNKTVGIDYVLTRHDFLFDYDKSTIVDDKKSREENVAKLKIAKDFILDPANVIKSDNKFSLIKVF